MEKKTFNDFCNLVAEIRGFDSYFDMATEIRDAGEEIPVDFWESVAEFFADQEKKAYAREAVKADREQVSLEFTFLDDTDTMVSIENLKKIHKNLPIELP